MRILIATTYRGIVGGVETHLRSVIPALASRGHQLALLYEYQAEEGKSTIDDGCPGLPMWHLADSKASLWEAQRWAPDICFSHDLEDPKIERVILDVFPSVLFTHAYHGTCISGAKRFGFPKETPCSRTFGKSCLALYFPCRCGGLNPWTMLRLYAVQQRRNKMLRDYRAVIAASRHMHEEFGRYGIAPERLRLVPLFPSESIPDAQTPQPREMSGRILMVGRFTNAKGGHLLVQAVAGARTVLGHPLTLVLAGDGVQLSKLTALAQRENVPLECCGWVEAKQREILFRSADLLSVPSTWPEPFGKVGIEAGCVGLPSVGFAVGGIRDWLIPGETGEAAEGNPPTSQGLSDAIVRALRDPEHHQRLRVGAWRLAHQFSLTAHLEQLEGILEGAVRS